MRLQLLTGGIACTVFSAFAAAIPISTDKLTGLTGGTPQGTAIYRADLSSLGLSDLASITINDNSSGLGGAPGQFSAFDLDGIVLSKDLCATAACTQTMTTFNVFDYSSAIFSPGAQRATADPKLFGTGATGTEVDDLVATLGSFDADSSTITPDGFLSLGDNGSISFNLTSLISTADLYLYFGEVGDNGEVAASNIEVSSTPVPVPEPTSFMLLSIGLLGLGLSRRNASQRG